MATYTMESNITKNEMERLNSFVARHYKTDEGLVFLNDLVDEDNVIGFTDGDIQLDIEEIDSDHMMLVVWEGEFYQSLIKLDRTTLEIEIMPII